jgi:hypothetical protein
MLTPTHITLIMAAARLVLAAVEYAIRRRW